MSKRIAIDWKMVTGFSGLLFLIIAVGFVGIRQIQKLSMVVGHLAMTDVPLQNAVLEMKSSNSKYAMGIRSYMFWRSAKYLDAVAVVGKLDLVRSASENFDKKLSFYASLAVAPQQKEWIAAIRKSQAELKSIGDKIIALVDKADTAVSAEKKGYEDSINRQLMDFENKLFQIDAFLDDPLQRSILGEIDRQLEVAQTGRKRSVSLLTWSMAIGLFFGGQTALLIYIRSKRERERRDLLTRRVIKLEEEERNNLSLQVHDQMGQDLSALKIYLGLIDRDLAPDARDPREKIEKTKKILDGLIEKTHNISELLRPPEIDDLGMVESIAALVFHYKEMTGMNYNYARPQEEIKISAEYSLTLYRVVQEALTNIAKYSKAKNVEISLEKINDSVRLGIYDDGVGFDYDAYLDQPARRKDDKMKLGLQGLRERIELLGGKMIVGAEPGRGTRLDVVLFI